MLSENGGWDFYQGRGVTSNGGFDQDSCYLLLLVQYNYQNQEYRNRFSARIRNYDFVAVVLSIRIISEYSNQNR
jgi:hypothetical protein